MAFCNSCGANITPGTRFCSKCGAAILASSLPPAATPQAAAGSMSPVTSSPPAQGGGALKVILIVVGVIVLLGILSVASIGFFAWRVARHAHVHQDGNNVTVETPFGSVKTTQDPAEAARNLGVDLYPGAEVSRNGAQSATFGGVHTASLTSESTDSVDKVSSFYKAKFPNAMVSSSDAGRCTIISNDNKTMITINIEARGDKTKIQITRVSRNSDSTNSSSN
jgi:flagellar basal body-associated protein FliL